jgi:general stress protein 26
MIGLDEILSHFKAINHVVLASVEGDQPRLRPVTLVHHGDGFFFATQSSDNKVRQLAENPKIELILMWQEPPNNGYIRMEGKAEKLREKRLIKELYESYDFMGKLWSGPDDPNLTIYEVKPSLFDYLRPGEWSTLKLKVK